MENRPVQGIRGQEDQDGILLVAIPDEDSPITETEALFFMRKASGISRRTICNISERNANFTAFGVVGVIKLPSASYLLLISERTQVASIFGHKVYRVTQISFHPFGRFTEISEYERKREETYREYIEHLILSGFYFSYTMDITRTTQQRNFLDPTETLKEPIWKVADEEFFWNRHISNEIIEKGWNNWILPLLHGYVGWCEVDGIEAAIVSRRGCGRAGVRYNARGVDFRGFAGNFVETEQIVSYQAMVASHVQVRGSVPLVWHQEGLKYQPVIFVTKDEDACLDACNAHLQRLFHKHGKVTCVSLLYQHGNEHILGGAFREYFERASPKWKDSFIAFDLHREKKGGKMKEAIEKLLGEAFHGLEDQGFFLMDAAGHVVSRQSGLFRTSCLDCLDRTNLAQFSFATSVLRTQFSAWGVLSGAQTLEGSFPAFYERLEQLWSENGDAISIQYVGTPALSGRRDISSKLTDGKQSLTRFFYNHFRDDFRQTAIEIFLGCDFSGAEFPVEAVISATSLWGPHYEQAIGNCVEEVQIPGEECQRAWIVLSVNSRGIEQQRVLILSDMALYRVKYNFSKKKIVRYEKWELLRIFSVEWGPVSGGNQRLFGARISLKDGSIVENRDITSDRVKLPSLSKSDELVRIFCAYLPGRFPLEAAREVARDLAAAIKSACIGCGNDEVLLEGVALIERKQKFFSATMNRLGLGKYKSDYSDAWISDAALERELSLKQLSKSKFFTADATASDDEDDNDDGRGSVRGTLSASSDDSPRSPS
jgi:phosphatidylinositol 4-phosphatase